MAPSLTALCSDVDISRYYFTLATGLSVSRRVFKAVKSDN